MSHSFRENSPESGLVQQRVRRWLGAAGLGASCLAQSPAMAHASGIDFFDPTAVRAANRNALLADGALVQSGVFRISAASSPNAGFPDYDLRREPQFGATGADVDQRAGGRRGNPRLTSNASEPADQAARPVGSTGLE